jgi:predicted nucleic acid-binding Zn ribbon protein
MPVYKYVCGKSREERCKLKDLPEEFFDECKLEGYNVEIETRLTELTEDDQIDVVKTPIVWSVFHMMSDVYEGVCPACGGAPKRTIGDMTFFFPGNCFLNKVDCKRQMALHKLENDDPYGHMRPEGDKEALVAKLKRGGKEAPKNFYPGGKGGLSAPKQHQPGT